MKESSQTIVRNKIKQLYFSGSFEPPKDVKNLFRWTGYSSESMIKTLSKFAPYLTFMYDCAFAQCKLGIVILTAVNDEGIRVSVMEGTTDYAWIHVPEIKDYKFKKMS